MDAEIEKLLILQDRDIKRIAAESALEAIPAEISASEKKIAEEKAEAEAEDAELKQLEIKRSDLDNQVQGAESKILKYKNQQLEVKKNEEYQALTHEIEVLEKEISELEEQEIAIMLELDEKKAENATKNERRAERVQLLNKEIENLKQRETNTKAEIDDILNMVDEAKAVVTPLYYRAYEKVQMKKVKPPFVSPLEGQMCSGCHLKVSGEVLSETKHFSTVAIPVHCDSCSRVVYWP